MASLLPVMGWLPYPFTGISIFDWPEHNQTSPARTSFKTISSLPVMVTEYGPPAPGVAIFVFHLPSLPDLASASSPHEAEIFTFLPGSSLPQMETVAFCCRIILLEKKEGSHVCADRASVVMINTEASVIRFFFI